MSFADPTPDPKQVQRVELVPPPFSLVFQVCCQATVSFALIGGIVWVVSRVFATS